MTMPARLHVLRALVLALAVALLAAAAAAPSALARPAAGAAAVADAPAAARLLACRHAASIDARVAVIGAWMKPLPAAQRLTLKIDLFQRQAPGGRWTQRTDVPGLGRWTQPSDALLGTQPGDVFRYRQAVGRLVLGYAYRFRVSFRWLDAAGTVVRESALTTRACRQPGPDLVPTAMQVDPNPSSRGGFLYSVTVKNAGRAPVQRALLAATYPGETTPNLHRHRTGRLLPGASVVIVFAGPPCGPGESPPAFVVDPDGLVEETNEANNQLVGTCPAP
ncbi:MAG TPA: CARDB domain-containing protein [Conexibacter sp.]|nr:CARDB domain-containing protein [Conexibacter sp.]